MNYETIKLEISTNNIAVLTLARPKQMNAMNTQMRAELTYAIRDAATKARVLVITGSGKAFCSGQDLSDGARASNLDLERTLRDEYVPLLKAIYDCPIPTIAAVNGAAAGAGANFALAADIVIAKESAYFLQAFTKIGLMPDAGGTYWLPRMMGNAKAMGATLFGEKISAKQADDWGMIWEAVPDEDFAATCKARALHLSKGPTLAYEHIKEAIRGGWDNSLADQLELEGRKQGACGKSRDFQEGIVAFVDKRPAHFEGR